VTASESLPATPPGWLARHAGLLALGGEYSPEAISALQGAAYAFLLAGGSLGQYEWAALSTAEQGALVTAGERLRSEQAEQVAEALLARLQELGEGLAAAGAQETAQAVAEAAHRGGPA
jgi:hypothetical protein